MPPPPVSHQPSKDQSQTPQGYTTPSPLMFHPPLMCHPPHYLCHPLPPHGDGYSEVPWPLGQIFSFHVDAPWEMKWRNNGTDIRASAMQISRAQFPGVWCRLETLNWHFNSDERSRSFFARVAFFCCETCRLHQESTISLLWLGVFQNVFVWWWLCLADVDRLGLVYCGNRRVAAMWASALWCGFKFLFGCFSKSSWLLSSKKAVCFRMTVSLAKFCRR